jgi:hypothetical protein
VGFSAEPDGAFAITFDVDAGPFLTLVHQGGRSRFWMVWPDDELEPTALPSPERWGFLPHGVDGEALATQLRSIGRQLIKDFRQTGELPLLEEPFARLGPSYNSPGA